MHLESHRQRKRQRINFSDSQLLEDFLHDLRDSIDNIKESVNFLVDNVVTIREEIKLLKDQQAILHHLET